jgi:hypothetical protein
MFRSTLVSSVALFLGSYDAMAWERSEKTDAMRGTTSVIYQLNSTSEGLPEHNKRKAILFIQWKDNKELLASIGALSRDLFSCYNICTISYKFDDKPIKTLNAFALPGYELLGLLQPSQFVAELKASQRLIIEAPIYSRGNVQFAFTVSGFPEAIQNTPSSSDQLPSGMQPVE